MTITDKAFVRRLPLVLSPDTSRVVSKLFIPGHEVDDSGRERSSLVLERVMALSDSDVDSALAVVYRDFHGRHRNLAGTLETHFRLVAHRIVDGRTLTTSRRQLVGAYFTQEYALEAAALFNPSMVAHPDQSGARPGEQRFVMSLRAVGEGHLSSVEFRSGTIAADGEVRLDVRPTTTVLPEPIPATYSRAVFDQQQRQLGVDQQDAGLVLGSLPESFVRQDLDVALASLRVQGLSPEPVARTVEAFERIAACNYSIRFPADSQLAERVISPRSPSESHGLEDVRLVRFVDDDGRVEYQGTYTAFDGVHVVPQLLRTSDFLTFHMSQLSGPAARNKGMALFPRRVGGQRLALSRWDQETSALAASDDLVHWESSATLHVPVEPWELVQVGNCGPPLETPAGWLVLTHGVGPMREYRIGAALLDLEDPRKVLGQLKEPILTPAAGERNGYVPNVVYTCGAMLVGDSLVLPYGCSDASVRFALIEVGPLLDALLASQRQA